MHHTKPYGLTIVYTIKLVPHPQTMMTDPVRMMRMMLLALVFILSVSMPCLSVYNSGECYFNTKGACMCVQYVCACECINHVCVCMYLIGSCEYMGQVYGIGESWMTKDCYQCVCMDPFGVSCCDQ